METHQLIRLMRTVAFLLLITISGICTGCVSLARIDGPYRGKVIDAETKHPLEGVVVHGTWYTVMGTVDGASSDWYDSDETLTDKNGEFNISGKGLLLFTRIDEMDLTIFKAGYEQWGPGIWSGFKHNPWQDTNVPPSVTWDGNYPTFRLKKLSMEERINRSVTSPSGPNNKRRLFLIERNKEMVETGMPASTLIPME